MKLFIKNTMYKRQENIGFVDERFTIQKLSKIGNPFNFTYNLFIYEQVICKTS